ncbi:bifunctional glycosyltransferase/CDP-glycerol:glycerophosphate glycerophosphotransferase [Thermomonospora echinospora]|uniref:bifunctional glycosyltransferase/CDP-glycerol:glycerophosphate glycerophosphotransferase n=1 Tax=Thermomonospora echinospora TaxID=1992 RepID=UPI001F3965A3|nr:bifunctional glycosyltransferase/CDP-glycerol:glycerophosphate glycerophosphotransferase [Thermomonospora echinospora]
MPFYNAEPFLHACLESLERQSLRDLEVLMVDDGSADGGAAVAKEFAERDPRFRLLQQENQGVGTARDLGVGHATGKYLAFADGDDVVPRHAYKRLVGSLESTGSDLACGNVHRLNGTETAQSETHRGLFGKAAEGLKVAQRPELLRDRACGNKVYRREFWDRHRLRFPSGPHESAPVTVKAYALASSIDLLKDTVYLWRGTDAVIGEHIDGPALAERLRAARDVRGELAGYAPQLLAAYDAEVLVGIELQALLTALPRVADTHQEMLTALGAELAEPLAAQTLRATAAITRLQLHLLGRRKLPELLEVLRFVTVGGLKETPVVRRGRKRTWYAAYPYFEDPGQQIPLDVYDVTDELLPVARLDRATWVDGRLRVEGHAYIPRLEAATPDEARIRLWLRGPHRLMRIPLSVQRRVHRPDVTAASGQSVVSHDGAGFVAEIDPSSFKVLGKWRTGDWKLGVEVACQGLRRRRTLGAPTAANRRWPQDMEVAPGVHVQVLEVGRSTAMRVRQVTAQLTGHRVDDDALELRGWTTAAAPKELVATAEQSGRRIRAKVALEPGSDGRSAFRARLPLAELLADLDKGGWDISLGDEHKVLFGEDPAEARYLVRDGETPLELALLRSRFGNLRAMLRTPTPVVTRIGWSGDELTVSGTYAGSDRPDRLLLHHQRFSDTHPLPLTWDGDRFTASFRPTRMPSLGLERPLGKGRWDLLAPSVDGDRPVLVERAKLRTLPDPHLVGVHEINVLTYATDALRLQVRVPLGEDAQGPYAQARLRNDFYPRQRREPVRELAVFDAYRARQYSCNPRGIFEELRRRDTGIECVWVSRDGQFTPPEGARTVLTDSREHYEAMARARFVFANWSLRPWYEKRPGQTYVQCWHGTPLKKLGYDVHDMPYKRNQGLIWMEHDVPQWDLLLSQNAFSVPLFRRAFRYEGEVFESGYPRNDLLRRPGQEELAARVRRRLGIPEGKRVIMYAPTWRDDLNVDLGAHAFQLKLDMAAAEAALGEDHVLLLRTHYLVTDRPKSKTGGFVVDVANYPDIAELYLITDVLVTDYSSAMFDFAVTGRPMVFFTYDLERYRDHVRGFYFDFEAEAPGPLLRTSDEVIDALRDLDRLPATYADAYAAFAARYCPHDDGHAAARVLDRLLG